MQISREKIICIPILPTSVYKKKIYIMSQIYRYTLRINEFIEYLPKQSSKLLHFVCLDESIINITKIYDTTVMMRSQRSLAIIICTKLKFTFPESSSSLGYTLASSKCHDIA